MTKSDANTDGLAPAEKTGKSGLACARRRVSHRSFRREPGGPPI